MEGQIQDGVRKYKAFCLPLEDDDYSIMYVVYMNVASNMADMPHNATGRDIGSQALLPNVTRWTF